MTATAVPARVGVAGPLPTDLLPDTGRCRVMGIVNVTPDSFSDGGRHLDVDAAVAHGHRLVADGADLVDVGGESTRPGAERVDEAEELRRVVPVVAALSAAGVVVSVDTMRGSVAAAAVAAGAALVNDVSGGLADPRMLSVVADLEASCVLMHWRGHSAVMESQTEYADVVADVRDELARRCEAALAAGVREDRIVLDPGLGFAKTHDQSWTVLAGLPHLLSLGFPVLVGASRKRFLAECADGVGPLDRDDASAAVATLAAAAGAWGLRVHEPAAALAASRCVARLEQAR